MGEEELIGGLCENFLWENQSWANLVFNSDNSGGCDGGGDEDKDLRKERTKKGQGEVEVVPPVQGKSRRGGGEGDGSKRQGSTSTDEKGKGKAGSDGGSGGGSGESDEHDMHIFTERERRKKMKTMFTNLHALLPQLPPKADKSTIVDEAVKYIVALDQVRLNLENLKEEREGSSQNNVNGHGTREAFLANHSSSTSTSATPMNPSANSSFTPLHCAPVTFQTHATPNVVLNVCGEEAQISVCCRKKPGLFSGICYILEKYKIGVVSAHVSSVNHRSMFMIQAHARGSPDPYLETFPADEIFKHAIGEIIMVVSS